ncbi:hypothetical protein AMTR_s00002p00147730 [Amborella trichopoda]|uniref:Uncharacterized protein n=1 Tax=Amborella trichopoda TaxID=13333 RepID=W1P0F1_AMBTC|nr:hypothetical protein AMTR_s00002p00147730 [Amborella trichopoda]
MQERQWAGRPPDPKNKPSMTFREIGPAMTGSSPARCQVARPKWRREGVPPVLNGQGPSAASPPALLNLAVTLMSWPPFSPRPRHQRKNEKPFLQQPTRLKKPKSQ